MMHRYQYLEYLDRMARPDYSLAEFDRPVSGPGAASAADHASPADLAARKSFYISLAFGLTLLLVAVYAFV